MDETFSDLWKRIRINFKALIYLVFLGKYKVNTGGYKNVTKLSRLVWCKNEILLEKLNIEILWTILKHEPVTYWSNTKERVVDSLLIL